MQNESQKLLPVLKAPTKKACLQKSRTASRNAIPEVLVGFARRWGDFRQASPEDFWVTEDIQGESDNIPPGLEA